MSEQVLPTTGTRTPAKPSFSTSLFRWAEKTIRDIDVRTDFLVSFQQFGQWFVLKELGELGFDASGSFATIVAIPTTPSSGMSDHNSEPTAPPHT